MSQTVVWQANLGTTVRKHRTSGATSGQGQSHRWYIGRAGSYDYDSYVRFAPVWTDVGRIVSASLTLYTDDGLGDMPSTTTEKPYVKVKRCVGSTTFVEGNAPDDEWQANDYTTASTTSSDQRAVNLSRAEMGLNNIDVTAIVEDWAPANVKRRNGDPGGREANRGLALFGSTDTGKNIGLVSDKWTDPVYRPIITLTFEYGHTIPDAPSNVSPSGSVAALTDFQGDFTDSKRPTDTLASSGVQVFDNGASATIGTNDVVTSSAHGLANGAAVYFTSLTGGVGLSTFTQYFVVARTTDTFKVSTTSGGSAVNVTDDYSAATWSKLLYSNGAKDASRTEIDADRFTHVPDNLGTLKANTTYRWRSRVTDNEGQVSPWTSLVSFSFQNTAPSAPTLSPANGTVKATPDGVHFRGTFTDADAGDLMQAYEVQMSAYPSGDARWDDDQYRLWNTGKRYITATAAPFDTPYGGGDLAAGTYYWRARVHDRRGGTSNWAYASIQFTASFEADPAQASTAIQLRPRAPWRIVIKAMGTLRGPGTTVAVIEDAKNVGASELYNSPGELHFTLPAAHPQISVIEPKQTHYSVQFRQGDGWHEVFAGLIDDFDATDTDVVFYGVDYLALLDRLVDERYDPSNPDLAAESGGSKYITAGKNSIAYIVGDQLTKAKALSNSPVGFIAVGAIATMNETLQVYSTYAPVLQFITGLLDSHRNGQNKRTRLRCRRTNAGGYEWLVQDNPGQVRDNLRMRFGELVQGYRVVAFGSEWGSRVAGIGRAKDGIKVMYDQKTTPGIDEGTWGRFTKVQLFDGVSDSSDFARRVQQAAVAGGKLGRSMGVGLRSGVLQPKDGYDVCDHFPISIEHGSVSTANMGSGYWTVVGITWECAAQDGKQNTTLSFQPREDSTPPTNDLLTLQPISPQQEWQVGWTPPVPPRATARYWLDQTTGIVYERQDDGTYLPLSGPEHGAPLSPLMSSAIIIDDDGGAVVRLTITFR
jgi:hypothetical protein